MINRVVNIPYVICLIAFFFLLTSCKTANKEADKVIIKVDYAITNVAVLPMTEVWDY